MNNAEDALTETSAPLRRLKDARTVLEVRDLRVDIPNGDSVVTPVDGVSLDLRSGEVLGIVGETGSGKTVTCRALLGLLPSTTAKTSGHVSYPGVVDGNVLDLGRRGMRRHWGNYVAMVPQNPMTSLNPVHRVGAQIEEAVVAHSRVSREERRARVFDLMSRVGIPVPEKRALDYPHQFSGGMLQRTLIAIALAGQPQILVADEPTTALDVIIQDQILSLLLELQREIGLSLVLVSHDLSVIAQVCDRVGVMYAGQLVELADAQTLLRDPQHPYTAALLSALPGAVPRHEPLATIPGSPPRLVDQPPTCRFRARCAFAESACDTWTTDLLPVDAGAGHRVRCRRHEELGLHQIVRRGDLQPWEASNRGAPIESMHAE
ncbi:MAG: ABC transporter ATP-binding protein [Motilibacteraceae bacterium]